MLPSPLHQISVNAANEGIPVAAIARVIQCPLDETYDSLKAARDMGSIADLPRADWPPGTRINDRLPNVSLPADGDLAFMCARAFKLTALEAGFMVSLLKHRQVEKSRLHGIVEHQRNTRQAQPDRMEATDPKMVDVMICKLRKKLKTVDADFQIKTLWGSGYFIEAALKPRIFTYLEGATDAPAQKPTPATDPVDADFLERTAVRGGPVGEGDQHDPGAPEGAAQLDAAGAATDAGSVR